MPITVTSQIEIDDQGVAWIVGANTKVVEVVLDKMAYGWSPEEMHFQHPHLILGSDLFRPSLLLREPGEVGRRHSARQPGRKVVGAATFQAGAS